MIKFLIGYESGVEWVDRLAEFGVAAVLTLIAWLTLWHLWDRIRFTKRDALDMQRILGAYDGKTSLEPATHAAPKRSRSPFVKKTN